MSYCFGVDIGGTTVKMGIFTVNGEVIDKWEIPTRQENKGEEILPDIAASICEKCEEHRIEKREILGIGVGVPAAISDGVAANGTANLGWGYKDVRSELEALTGLKVKAGNDANVAALGEMWKGGGQGYRNMVMVTLGTGVGGGIIINGQMIEGTGGAAGEIGHLYVEPNETEPCGCGKTGCLEQYGSATGVVKLAKKKLAATSKATVLQADTVTAKDVFDAVKAGDEVAIEIAQQFGQYLGHALSNIAAVVDPEAFVIGGGVSKAGEILFDFIERPYYEKLFFGHKKATFKLAQLGNDAGIYGAAKLILE